MAAAAVGSAVAISPGYDNFIFDEDELPFPSFFPTQLPDSNSIDMRTDTPTTFMDAPILGGNSLDVPVAREPSSSPLSPFGHTDAVADGSDASSSPNRVAPPFDLLNDLASLNPADSTSPGTTTNSLILTPTSTLLDFYSSGSEGADHLAESAERRSPGSIPEDTFNSFPESLVRAHDPGWRMAPLQMSGFRHSNPRYSLQHRLTPADSSASEMSGQPSPTNSSMPTSTAAPSALSTTPWNSLSASSNEWNQPLPASDAGTQLNSYDYVTEDAFSELTNMASSYPTTSNQYAFGSAFNNSAFTGVDDFVVLPHGPYPGSTSLRNPEYRMDQTQDMTSMVFPSDQHHGPLQMHRMNPAELQGLQSDTVRVVDRGYVETNSSEGSSQHQKRLPKPSTKRPVKRLKQPPVSETPLTAPAASQSKKPERSILPNDKSSHLMPPDHRNIGGRRKHSRLPETTRRNTEIMRKVAACWCCALRRDACDPGTPCHRCLARSQKGQAYYFECDRRKLPDLNHDFLPPSMTSIHQKQAIEDFVNDHVTTWFRETPVDVYLGSGYGPPLRWRLYEFRPKTDAYTGQLQYRQDPVTQTSYATRQYSPPLALLKLDAGDDAYFTEYINRLLERDLLRNFGWACFREESLVDMQRFQAFALQLMCDLYIETHDDKLRVVLKDILRMTIITYIMGHTLTIPEDSLAVVLSGIRGSRVPDIRGRHVSPRIANRQLKFFFSILRNNLFDHVLRWQQQTLHGSAAKDKTWLPVFCATLGFAMNLEEIQRTLQVQADYKVATGEMTFERATTVAGSACERIDNCYTLLIGLFQCKYRDKAWGVNGSFGPGTPLMRDPASHRFLQTLNKALRNSAEHLESRRNVQYAPENQCLYTSRLVARFLLPFLNLPE